MPYTREWVPPELYMDHAGVRVYHAYKDGEWEEQLRHWFTTDGDENPTYEFDIRDVATKLIERGLYSEAINDAEQYEQILRIAIDNQLLKIPPQTEA